MQWKNKYFIFHSLLAFHGSLDASIVFTKQSSIFAFVNLMILGLSFFLAAKVPFKCRVCYVFIGPKRNFLIKVLESNKSSQFYSSQSYQNVNCCRLLVGTLSQQGASPARPLLNPHHPPGGCTLAVEMPADWSPYLWHRCVCAGTGRRAMTVVGVEALDEGWWQCRLTSQKICQ